MPFRTRPGQPRDLLTLVDQEVRERIEEAVDYVSLEVLVERRRRRGLPGPAADSASDRQEFDAGVRAFLERLRADITPALAPERRRKAEEGAARAGDDPLTGLVGLQVVLAKELPDYWPRFEAVRQAYTREQTMAGGERPGVLRRLFSR
jgi:hypothetical protein